METEKELNEKITALTTTIQSKYPELSKYIAEMTVTIPDENNPDVHNNALKQYYDSLLAMVKKYAGDHGAK